MTNLNTELARHESARHTLSVGLAISEREILSAQKLRYRVFADELGARLNPRTPGVDQDIFDPYCEHLVVRDERSGEVIGTYRILSPEQAKAVGSYYSETEFDLIRLQHLRPRMVEIGRSCVHPDYRTGATIALLWSGLAQYMTHRGYDYLIGCASISMRDGGHVAASLWEQLRHTHLAPIEVQVRPRLPLPVEELDRHLQVQQGEIQGYIALLVDEGAYGALQAGSNAHALHGLWTAAGNPGRGQQCQLVLSAELMHDFQRLAMLLGNGFVGPAPDKADRRLPAEDGDRRIYHPGGHQGH